MGCDIHVYVELYDDREKEWYALDKFEQVAVCHFDVIYPHEKHVEPLHKRNYAVFSWLAGVRQYGDIKPICEPRGLPKDVSEVVALAFKKWGPDAHTPSYLTLQEILDAPQEGDVEFSDGTFPLSKVLEPFVKCVRLLPSKFYSSPSEHLRLVFWFDN